MSPAPPISSFLPNTLTLAFRKHDGSYIMTDENVLSNGPAAAAIARAFALRSPDPPCSQQDPLETFHNLCASQLNVSDFYLNNIFIQHIHMYIHKYILFSAFSCRTGPSDIFLSQASIWQHQFHPVWSIERTPLPFERKRSSTRGQRKRTRPERRQDCRNESRARAGDSKERWRVRKKQSQVGARLGQELSTGMESSSNQGRR